MRVPFRSFLIRGFETFSYFFLARFRLFLDFATTFFHFDNGTYTEHLHRPLNHQHRLIHVIHPTKMRRYDIVLGILLILSVFDFALAAPVLVQEKRQVVVDVMQIPKDMITVFGKRAGEELDQLEKLAEEYLETSKEPVESSDAHASSSSALPVPGPDHGSMNDVQVPEPNPASSTTANDANPGALMELSNPSSTDGLWHDDSAYDADADIPGPMHESDDEVLGPMRNPPLTNYGSGYGLTGVHGSQPNPNSRLPDSSTNWDNSDTNWDHWIDLDEEGPSLKRLKLEEPDQAYEEQAAHMQQPNPGTSDTGPSNPGTSNIGLSSPILPTEPGYGVVTAPSPSLGLPMEPDDEWDDRQAALYAAKGKAKEARHRIPRTAGDVGNAA